MTTEGGGKPRFYMCGCFTTDNIFLDDYKLHVRFVSEQQFRLDYRTLLRRLGCITEQQFEDVLRKVYEDVWSLWATKPYPEPTDRTVSTVPPVGLLLEKRSNLMNLWSLENTSPDEISQEVDRRRWLSVSSAERVAVIKRMYQPLHPHVYRLQESFLSLKFRQVVEYCRSSSASKEGLLDLLKEEAAPRVYCFHVFEKRFCEELVEEMEHFEQSAAPKGRPNTMNHYGILLNELGFDEGFITPLRQHYLHPVTSLLYPDCGGCCLDSHKAFVVKYDVNEDLDLSYHYDNAEVTLNVSLGKEFTDGNLYFGDMRQVPISETECTEVEHRVTKGLLHRGQHMHGALPISSGQRWNLIIWMRASQERNKLCPMCNKRPRLVEGDGFADGFTKHPDAAWNVLCVLT